MSEKSVVIEGRTVLLREEPRVPVLAGDVVVEARLFVDGTLALSLGELVADLGGESEVRVNARLRLAPQVVSYIEAQLARWREERAAAAADLKKTAN
jgi:hypothetical protein